MLSLQCQHRLRCRSIYLDLRFAWCAWFLDRLWCRLSIREIVYNFLNVEDMSANDISTISSMLFASPGSRAVFGERANTEQARPNKHNLFVR